MRLLAFARARDVFGFSEQEVTPRSGETPAALLDRLFPAKRDALPKSTRPAVDAEYVGWDVPIPEGAKELAILPPVSGG
ncbi:MAG TPA: MoaD/ThiS family protein [Candidatus Methylacidiphilales bacterium]